MLQPTVLPPRFRKGSGIRYPLQKGLPYAPYKVVYSSFIVAFAGFTQGIL